jgi:hypothetical protein
LQVLGLHLLVGVDQKLSGLVVPLVQPSPWVRGGVDLFQHTDRNVRIDLRGIEPYVAKHRLDVANVRAAFEHQRRHGMAEDVTCSTLADPRRFYVLPSQPAQVVRREWGPILGKENNTVIRFLYDFRPESVQIHV